MLGNLSDNVGLDQASSFLNTILVVTTLQLGVTVSLISAVGSELPYDNGCTINSVRNFWYLNSISICISACITVACFIILGWTTYVSASDEEAIEGFMDAFGLDIIMLCLTSIINFWFLGACILQTLCFYIAAKDVLNSYTDIFFVFSTFCIIYGLYILYKLSKINRKRHRMMNTEVKDQVNENDTISPIKNINIIAPAISKDLTNK